MDYYSKYIKRKILSLRLLGILSSLAGIGFVLFYYFNIINHWLCGIMICYIIALNFLVNSSYQEIFSGVKMSRTNLIIAILFLLFTIVLIIYTIVTGQFKY